MSRRKPLTCQSKKVCIVIRKDKEISINKIKDYCNTYFERYAFIEHKNDIDCNSGLVIPPHYHLVGDFITSKVPFSTRLNEIVNFFGFDNAIGIEIDQYNSLESSIQYLTHKNQSEKTPHKVEEIIHNFDKADFNILYNAESGNIITFDFLLHTCLEANNIIDVIKKIGIVNYRTYRNVIWDIWNTIKGKEDYINA